ncbi:DUF4229 domain-containing protein [Auritidibacter ignavus]|uniref:DUF4229 domain-containing protein n=1 Tax=Auritidibacter ignavus TaxID=678932 RepID=A0AAJ6ALH4_9MICC|nr:DUF4229 domain-containing protein [Auritidibacter ignavus]WGH93053.1 DUF4229 domain-containing protein [Auritidibacter ignavus]
MKFLVYGGLRLLLFGLAFAITAYVTSSWPLAASWIFATVIGLIVSFAVGYLLLDRLRNAAGQNLADIFSPNRKENGVQELKDAEAEDSFTAGRFHDAQQQRGEAEAEAQRAATELDAQRSEKR